VEAPRILAAEEAGRALERSFQLAPGAALTVADASTKSGLALRDAERGLYWLTQRYRGHLRVGEAGDLVFLFPTGLTRPWETRDAFDRAVLRVGKVAASVGRFVVRAWIMIVLLGYAGLFLALLIASIFARSQNDSNSRSLPGAELLAVFFRVLADAIFWTFHPFSPFAYAYAAPYDGYRARSRKDETPFYEKVNRFFFGPREAPEDPRQQERAILSQLRQNKGRIGLADVMRVTGLPRDEADPLMARLMLDYDGEVEVSEEGGIFYRFASMRKTAGDSEGPQAAQPIWKRIKELPPLTGNTGESNALIAGLNVFNLMMSFFAMSSHLTLEKVGFLFKHLPHAVPPPEGTAWALGIVPFVFSIALFALPLGRALLRPTQKKELLREKGRVAVLREVLSRVESKQRIDDSVLAQAWAGATQETPDPKAITREVVQLGGSVEIEEEGATRYRFVDLETEQAALEAEREAASEAEAKVGRVVFTSE
jgi:hypothetical protein